MKTKKEPKAKKPRNPNLSSYGTKIMTRAKEIQKETGKKWTECVAESGKELKQTAGVKTKTQTTKSSIYKYL